ncbi:MAG: DMT family transporter [Pseudomonadota bacterium]|nr:DMT family transporter [Pseudomonadota bacterium]
MPQTRFYTLIGAIFVLLSAVLFAIKAILIKYSYGLDPNLDGVTLLALRMASALPFFLLIAWFAPRVSRTITCQDWGLLLVAGLVGYYLASILDFVGLEYISASLERIILFLYPTLTVLMTAAIYGQPIAARTWLAIVLSYGGTLVVMLGEGWQALIGDGVLWGSALVFAGAVAYASYLVMTPTLIQRFGSWRFTGLAMSVACIASILHFVWVTPAPMVVLQGFSSQVIWLGVALGFFSTVLPATLLMQGIQRIGAAQAALISAGGPVLTILLAVALLGEHLNWIQWIGCALNIIGVLMITLKPKAAKIIDTSNLT